MPEIVAYETDQGIRVMPDPADLPSNPTPPFWPRASVPSSGPAEWGQEPNPAGAAPEADLRAVKGLAFVAAVGAAFLLGVGLIAWGLWPS